MNSISLINKEKLSSIIKFMDDNSYEYSYFKKLGWNLKNIDITPDKTDDVDVIITSLVKLFKDVSTKTNCFNVLFINSSIFFKKKRRYPDD